MANIYLRSTDGSDGDNGSTWDLAKATLVGAAAIDAEGDTVYVSQSHSEVTAGLVNAVFAGTLTGTTTRIICANDGAEPPTTPTTGGEFRTSGNNSILISGTTYFRGLKFKTGEGASSTASITFNGKVVLDECDLELVSTGVGSAINLNSGAILSNCWVKFGAAQSVSGNDGFRWSGGGIRSGGTSPTTLVGSLAGGRILEGLDLSNGSSSMNIFSSSGTGFGIIRNCKLPASWSGSLVVNFTEGARLRASMYNCDSGDTNYKVLIQDGAGTIRDETTVVRSGGASDGTTPISWKMASNAAADYFDPLYSDEIILWNDVTGASKTVTVEILRDSATNLKDDEVWLEVQYLGTSGNPMSLFANDKCALLDTPADQASSSVTWTTTGLSNPNKQKVAVTFTPQEKGFFIARVALAKASSTIYVCPKLAVT